MPIIDLSNDFRMNADIIRLINIIAANQNELIDKFEHVYKNMYKYLNFDQSLIIPILLEIELKSKNLRQYLFSINMKSGLK